MRFATATRFGALTACLLVSIAASSTGAPDDDPPLSVLKTGLGSGNVTGSGITCGTVCDANFTGTSTVVTLTATADPGSTFMGWSGPCTVMGSTCTVTMSTARAVVANFQLSTAITQITDFTPSGLETYLTAHPEVNTPARFVAALPQEYRQNWILMSRSESLQTGTAHSPRILMPSNDARSTFSIGMTTNSSYPGAHPNAIEYMQWDAAEKNFRFHEVIVDNIPAMPPPSTIPARPRGVSVDDYKCGKCHSTQNVINRTASNGTSGLPGGVKFKNKPNWDAYDSWGGMTPFNRDRIYQGSVEAAAFRATFNLWNWRNSAENDGIRQFLEQLQLQSSAAPGTPHAITRNIADTTNTGHIVFGFDGLSPITPTPVTSAYNFGGTVAGPSTVQQGGRYVTLRVANPIPPLIPPSINDNYMNPGSDEGRGVQLFDLLGGLDGQINAERIADELIDHRFATGSVPIDVRPITLAIADNCLSIDHTGSGSVTPALTVDFSFFNARNGVTGINDVFDDTQTRSKTLPHRKADIQKLNLDRTGDPYVMDLHPENGLIAQHTGGSTATSAIRQEVFQRPVDLGNGDTGTPSMGGLYVDRERYVDNTEKMAMFRYFLEPLGVSVDKWSMSVRGRSRAYNFADIFNNYLNVLIPAMRTSLGLGSSTNCAVVLPLVNSSLASLPPANAVPTYTDVQRIFNKSCIECHGDLHYPPYENAGTTFNLSEEEMPVAGVSPMHRPFTIAQPKALSLAGPIYTFITRNDETCPPGASGMMPCGGPALSKADVETIRRWIVGGTNYTEGDPHIQTIDNVHYDFQGAGEYVLLRDLDMEIQARQTPVLSAGPLGPNDHTGLTSCVSINTAAAVRVGPHRVTYQSPIGGQTLERGPELRIDGKLTTLAPGAEIDLPSGGRVYRDSTTDPTVKIDTPGGTNITISSNLWPPHQVYFMNIDVQQGRATEGIMGAIAPHNWLPALPDGTQLGPRPAGLHQRYIDLYQKFGSAWRVTAATSLFDYAPGTSTATFTNKDWPVENPTSCTVPALTAAPGGPEKPLGKETAAQLCGRVTDKNRQKNCLQDVMVTGDQVFALGYGKSEATVRHPHPAVPILGFPADRATIAGPIAFTFAEPKALESAAVKYRQCIWPIEKQFTLADCDPKPIQPELTKDALLVRKTASTPAGIALKSGRSYFWKVIAVDASGTMTESQTRRFVIQ